jgi:hypothetical protein
VDWFTTTGFTEKLTEVVVWRVFTVSALLSLLPLWTDVALNVALMLWVPAAAGFSVTVQLAVAPLPERTQGPLNGSPPEFVRTMVPAGVRGDPAGSSSVTATITWVGWFTTTGFTEKLTEVVVWRVFTVSALLSLLPLWTDVALNVALMLWVPAAAGFSVTVQLAVAPLPERTHGPLNGSPPEFVNEIVPVGVTGEPAASVSVTVTVTVDG